MYQLTLNELDMVSGGVDGQEVADGVATAAGATLAIALAPEAALGALAVGSYLVVMAAAGALIGNGAAKK